MIFFISMLLCSMSLFSMDKASIEELHGTLAIESTHLDGWKNTCKSDPGDSDPGASRLYESVDNVFFIFTAKACPDADSPIPGTYSFCMPLSEVRKMQAGETFTHQLPRPQKPPVLLKAPITIKLLRSIAKLK